MPPRRAAQDHPGRDLRRRRVRIPDKDGAARCVRAAHPIASPLETEMALLRRALVALGIAGLIAAVLRIRGTGGTPPQSGGWRELSGPDLR